MYTACVHKGWGADDDSSIPRLFLHGLADDIIFQQSRSPGRLARNDIITIQTIIDIFAGVHLALASEAMAFTEAVGLDTQVMYDIISQAAGSNAMFVRYVPKMFKPTWSLRDVGDVRLVGQKLVSLETNDCWDVGVLLIIPSLSAGYRAEQGECDWSLNAYGICCAADVPLALGHSVTSPDA